MAGSTDFLPVANGAGANVESQAQYVLDLGPGGSLQNGYQTGVAKSAQYNKTMRQSSMISAAVANLVANTLNANVPDDGNLANLIAQLTSAITQLANTGAWSTGDVKLTYKAVADTGWVLMNDGSIGSAGSGATTRANADTQPLYILLWNNISNTWAPVSGGRGGSGAADFAANKRLTLAAAVGRVLGIAGAGSGLTARQLGQALGEETHLLLAAESGVGAHSHTFGNGSTAPGNGATNGNSGQPQNGVTSTVSANASQAHNIMQPTSFLQAMVKL